MKETKRSEEKYSRKKKLEIERLRTDRKKMDNFRKKIRQIFKARHFMLYCQVSELRSAWYLL